MTIWNKKSTPSNQYTTADRITQAGDKRVTQAGDQRIIPLLLKFTWDKSTSISGTVWYKITNITTIWSK